MEKFYFTKEEKALSKAKALVHCVRRMIDCGMLKPGDRLPSTQELAAGFDMSVANVQRSLSALVHEGSLKRRPHYGTVVCESEKKLKFVAIIIFVKPERGPKPYQQSQAALLTEELHKRGCEAITLTESLDKPDFSRLERVLQETGVQGIIPLEAPARLIRRFGNINIPLATTSGVFKDNGVYADFAQLPVLAEEILKKENCRRPAVISHVLHDRLTYCNAKMLNRMLDDFEALVERYSPGESKALYRPSTRPLWAYQPEEELTGFAYNTTMEILQNPTPPDAIIITTDEFAHGVIHAILQSGARPLLIFYRNHEIRIFNPLPAYYLEVTQRETALQLIDILVKQFEGEETERKLIHFNIVPPKENNL